VIFQADADGRPIEPKGPPDLQCPRCGFARVWGASSLGGYAVSAACRACGSQLALVSDSCPSCWSRPCVCNGGARVYEPGPLNLRDTCERLAASADAYQEAAEVVDRERTAGVEELVRACSKLGINVARLKMWRPGEHLGDDDEIIGVDGAILGTVRVRNQALWTEAPRYVVALQARDDIMEQVMRARGMRRICE
jgi:hypothetical protein